MSQRCQVMRALRHPAVLAGAARHPVAREGLELARLNLVSTQLDLGLSYGQRQRVPDLVSLAVNIRCRWRWQRGRF